ncbi:MAG TPA: hypothetical protein VFQ87_09045 [Bradyrhizobium sp.]|nr:hypothetical protein [Bradyrhizobium sp.]
MIHVNLVVAAPRRVAGSAEHPGSNRLPLLKRTGGGRFRFENLRKIRIPHCPDHDVAYRLDSAVSLGYGSEQAKATWTM